MSTSPPPADLRVLGGRPSEDELAAVVVALAALAAPAVERAEPAPEPTSGWSARWRGLRSPLNRGPGAWRGGGR